MEGSPDRIIEIAPGYTAWLRDRDTAVAEWQAVLADPDLRQHCVALADDELEAEMDRLKNPVLSAPNVSHAGTDAPASGSEQQMQSVLTLRSRALAFVDGNANLISWSPFFCDLKQAVTQALSECADDPDRVRELNALSTALAASGERAARARSLVEDLGIVCRRALDIGRWSETGGRPIHKAPGFAEWRDEADNVLARCVSLIEEPEFASHLERAGASGESVRAATAMLRDNRYRRPLARQQIRQETKDRSMGM
ncbi:MAG: hypothetical protein OXE76_14510 [Alphaproteobacteria bacterium]|nr:hypothetical protein [Alphaproteobacteria bacterium]